MISKGLFLDIITLLQQLIQTPSFSKEEEKTGDLIFSFLKSKGVKPLRKGHNIWAKNRFFEEKKPTILLNSHHDTVKPVKDWTKDPFGATLDGDYLYGLGSNDAGASLMGLLASFLYFFEAKKLPYNLVFAATAEEEISGKNGIASVVNDFGKIDLGLIGEPTQMQLAIAEKGLMVVDCLAKGRAGHAAREEGDNAITKAVRDIQWINDYEFDTVSDFLGKTKMTVTQINAGTQHNVVPDACSFVIDVRTNELHTNEYVYNVLKDHLLSEVTPRSFRLNSSKIELTHPVVQKGLQLGLTTYGSPTLSDQALLQGFPTLKIGIGKSERSHTADEFILISEIEQGIKTYINLLEGLNL